jgi:hypothetical protein
MLVYLMAIWSILQPFGIFCGHMVRFMVVLFDLIHTRVGKYVKLKVLDRNLKNMMYLNVIIFIRIKFNIWLQNV